MAASLMAFSNHACGITAWKWHQPKIFMQKKCDSFSLFLDYFMVLLIVCNVVLLELLFMYIFHFIYARKCNMRQMNSGLRCCTLFCLSLSVQCSDFLVKLYKLKKYSHVYEKLRTGCLSVFFFKVLNRKQEFRTTYYNIFFSSFPRAITRTLIIVLNENVSHLQNSKFFISFSCNLEHFILIYVCTYEFRICFMYAKARDPNFSILLYSWCLPDIISSLHSISTIVNWISFDNWLLYISWYLFQFSTDISFARKY